MPLKAAPLLDVAAVRTHRLENGLEVRLLADPGIPAVAYYTFFKVGSRNERPGITGISHLFEHMMFNGAKKYGPKEFDRVLESRGGTSNAYTSTDVTAYYDDFASDALETVIDLESDRMRSLALTPETLAQERQVVMEERRLRTDNSTYGMMEEQLEAMVFLAHPYRWPVVGWMSDIERISREDCQAYFRTYYAPNNAVIYAVGDLDPAATLAEIERQYGDIPSGPPPPPVADAEPPQRGERRAEIRWPAQSPAWLAGWRAPRAKETDSAALDLLQMALAVGEGSRLRRRLVEDTEAALSVSIGWAWRLDPGVFFIFAELPPKGSLARVEAQIEQEIHKVAEKGIRAAEMTRAQNLLRSAALHEMSTHNGIAHAMGSAEFLLGDWREAARSLERYAAVTLQDVKRVAGAILDSRKKSVVTLVPEGA